MNDVGTDRVLGYWVGHYDTGTVDLITKMGIKWLIYSVEPLDRGMIQWGQGRTSHVGQSRTVQFKTY